MFCYNVQQIASHKPGAMLWQVLPPVKALGHRKGAEQGKEYHAAQSIKGQSVAESISLRISYTAAAPATPSEN